MRHAAEARGPITILVDNAANDTRPGMVVTPRQLDLWLTPETMAAHLARQCLKEHLAPCDIVDATLFLASDVSRMMTRRWSWTTEWW